ncbi:MAG: pirin family protein [Deltaproteobacteria bacterium]|nr:pirin family protein [Deltaproteobacteria bacterium]
MMIVRPSAERGHLNFGWLDTYHSFSFGNYYDPRHMGFRALRVINEDRIAPNSGFPTHPHDNMEILTYVMSGTLSHEDSMGNAAAIRAGEMQRMTAGTGVTHSEANLSPDEVVHLLQIWILPETRGLKPGYEERMFTAQGPGVTLLASREGRQGSLTLHQDLGLYAVRLEPGPEVTQTLAPGRHAWVQVTRGRLALNDRELGAGDGMAISEIEALRLKSLGKNAGEMAEALLFDLN